MMLKALVRIQCVLMLFVRNAFYTVCLHLRKIGTHNGAKIAEGPVFRPFLRLLFILFLDEHLAGLIT